MNIFVYYGNFLNEKSKTKNFLDTLKVELETAFPESSLIVRNSNNTSLSIVGHWDQVIQAGNSLDDKETIKGEIFNSDVVIFISPVFVHNVSGLAKLFIDKFGSWVHTMPLIGKLGVPISLSATNGNEFVNDYLQKVLSYWGLSTVKPIGIQLDNVTSNALDSYVRFIVAEIKAGLKNPDSLISREQEKIYNINRSLLLNYDVDHPERVEFEQLGYKNCISFKEAFTKVNNTGIARAEQG